MNKSKIRMLLFSDLHAFSDQKFKNDSRMEYIDGFSEFAQGFISYLEHIDPNLDILLCSGDITNKACIKGFSLGWNFIHEVKSKFSIPYIACVPGNHDHQSRIDGAVFDPKHNLQFVDPSFPTNCKELNTHFWAWHWTHTELDSINVNIISLNSSAYHGFDEEHIHGRVSSEASNQIRDYIKSNSFNGNWLNILLCHHHPEKMDYVDHDYDVQAMEGGSNLIRALQESNSGPWFIAHGHKHFADITYAKTSCIGDTTIFSAGSLAAKLYPNIEDRTSNQFYIVEIDLEKTIEEGRAVGVFEAYEWTVGAGWHPSKSKFLPAKGGFGSTTTPKKLANQISRKLESSPPFLDAQDLLSFNEVIRHYTPNEFNKLVDYLSSRDLLVEKRFNELVEVGMRND